MFKLLFLLLCALGAALYFPESRAVVLTTIEPALNPAFRWSTNGELDRIMRDLQTVDRTSTGGIPENQEAFEAWLDRRYQVPETTYDAWGTRYRLESDRGSFTVISAGHDRQFGTEHDIRLTSQRVVRNRPR